MRSNARAAAPRRQSLLLQARRREGRDRAHQRIGGPEEVLLRPVRRSLLLLLVLSWRLHVAPLGSSGARVLSAPPRTTRARAPCTRARCVCAARPAHASWGPKRRGKRRKPACFLFFVLLSTSAEDFGHGGWSEKNTNRRTSRVGRSAAAEQCAPATPCGPAHQATALATQAGASSFRRNRDHDGRRARRQDSRMTPPKQVTLARSSRSFIIVARSTPRTRDATPHARFVTPPWPCRPRLRRRRRRA